MQSESGGDAPLSRYITPPGEGRPANRRLNVIGSVRYPTAPRRGQPRTRARGLVRLTLLDDTLRLGPMFRLRWLIPDWTIPYADLSLAQPVRGRVGGGGVRLTVGGAVDGTVGDAVGGTHVAFLCRTPTDILRVLDERGVPVRWEWETVDWASLE